MAHCDADDRDTWIRVGMALKNGLGERGQRLWHIYSRQSSKYRERDAVMAWTSFQVNGGINFGTIFHYAKQGGWQPSRNYQSIRPQPQPLHAEPSVESEQTREARWDAAANHAQNEWARAMYVNSDYLRRKGLTYSEYIKGAGSTEVGMKAPMKDGMIVAPMFCMNSGKMMAVQLINDQTGRKLFYPKGCRTSNTAFVINIGERYPKAIWLCEGYATGLTIHRALIALGRGRDQVACCFSANNIKNVARSLRSNVDYERADIFVCADHDCWRCRKCGLEVLNTGEVEQHLMNGSHLAGEVDHRWMCEGSFAPAAGEKVALEIGLRWVMPRDYGDFNDLLLSDGLEAVKDSLFDLVSI